MASREDRLEAKDVIKSLLALEDGLTDWEVEFVESVSKQDWERWSDKQVAIILRIADQRL